MQMRNKLISIFLSLIFVFLLSCDNDLKDRDNKPPVEKDKIIANTYTVNLGLSQVNIYEDYLAGGISEKIKEYIENTVSDMREKALSVVEILTLEHYEEYFYDHRGLFNINIRISYAENSIISVFCTVSYIYFGNEIEVYIDSFNYDIENNKEITLKDILFCDDILLENILMLGYSQYSDYQLPSDLTEDGIGYISITDFFINDEQITFFIKDDFLGFGKSTVFSYLEYYGNEELFKLNITQ